MSHTTLPTAGAPPAPPATIAWFDQLGREDGPRAGGKGANLGELTRAGLPVPPGFVILAGAYLEAMDAAGVRAELRDLATAGDEPGARHAAAERAIALVQGAGVPEVLGADIAAAYARLGRDVRVAVRSSATAEDTAGTSFAGMNQTFTNVEGEAELLDRLRDCWASLYGPRVVVYRATQAAGVEPAIAVVVQRMVNSERSGVMFSADPATGDTSRVVIEAAFGLGEVVVGGQVVPDTYLLDKDGPNLREVRIGQQSHQIVRGTDGHDLRVELTGADALRRVLSDGEAVELARLALRVEDHYGSPQDMEWAIENSQTYLVQSRPITAMGGVAAPAATAPAGPGPADRTALLTGLPGAPGQAAGLARILASPDEGERFMTGEVLVATMTSPDWVPVIRRAAAVVTDSGGMTCHAAIVAREMGVPCVVGTRTATSVLRTGEVVTVDGTRGAVYPGQAALAAPARTTPVGGAAPAPAALAALAAVPTATKLFVNLAVAERAEQVAALPVDGVGLLRAGGSSS
jgi:pyruvate,water dikinase